jgi:peptidoglycan/LPS O-acetylase OafA/YrhL
VKISPAQSDFLNWSRWVAAWLVVAEHARSLIFVDYGELRSPGVWAKGFYFLTGFGHEAVMVFFVISGYLVGGKVWNLYREGRFGWRRYLADRASRLYAVLFVALLLGAAMDWTGYLFFNKYGLYNQGYEGAIAVLGAAPIERMGWWDFLVNAFFLQTIAGPTFGSNGPLWSLAYEWWYYVLFPGILLVVFRKSLIGLTVGAALTVLLLFVLPSDIIWLFGIWLLGVAAAIVTPRTYSGPVEYASHSMGERGLIADGVKAAETLDPRRSTLDSKAPATSHSPLVTCARISLAGLFFIVVLLLARVEVLKGPYVWQYLLGVAYALLLVSLAGCQWRLPVFRSSAYLADFSYSVYLIHFPVLMFVVSGAFSLTGYGIKIPFGVGGLIWFAVVFASAILFAWLVSMFTERNTHLVRVWFYSILQIQLANK